MEQHAKYAVDGIAAGAAFASLAGWLPTALACVASLLAIVYHSIQIWRTIRKPKG